MAKLLKKPWSQEVLMGLLLVKSNGGIRNKVSLAFGIERMLEKG